MVLYLENTTLPVIVGAQFYLMTDQYAESRSPTKIGPSLIAHLILLSPGKLSHVPLPMMTPGMLH